jgi:hypothetical protein
MALRARTGELQGVVRLDGATDVELATVVQRPATVLGLVSAQIHCDLCFQRRIDFVEVVHHHDVFGRNGAVCLQLEHPVARLALALEQPIAGGIDASVQ